MEESLITVCKRDVSGSVCNVLFSFHHFRLVYVIHWIIQKQLLANMDSSTCGQGRIILLEHFLLLMSPVLRILRFLFVHVD